MRVLTVVVLLVSSAAASSAADAQRFEVPNRAFSPDQVGQVISGQLGTGKHNQPSVVSGALLLAGNATFSFFDISNPYAPAMVSEFASPYSDGEAESHQLSFARYADGRIVAATISGRGIDLWDLTDVRAPGLLSSIILDGVLYGDRTEAVWGVAHQGRYIYVGGTNTGLHIVDALDPENPVVVGQMAITEFGGVSAGPLWAVGNLLVITTPKSSAGIATLDISSPESPRFLDAVTPERASYIGGFFGATAYLINPLRAYDVTSDPRAITLVGTHENVEAEYLNFGNGRLYLGGKRPNPGLDIYSLPTPGTFELAQEIHGRDVHEIDDQFTVPLGNLVVLSDDQLGIGSVLAVESAEIDDVPPSVLSVNPRDGSTSQAPSTRIGVSLSDQVDINSLDTSSFVVRRVGDEEPLAGSFGLSSTVATFSPAVPLDVDATYEVIVPAGGVSDLVGNAVPETFRSVFSTGADLLPLDCGIEDTPPQPIGSPVAFRATTSGDAFFWEFGDGTPIGRGSEPSHIFDEPGRFTVTLRVRAAEREVACTRVHIAHAPRAPHSPTQSNSIAIDDDSRRVVVVNADADSITLIDADTHQRIQEVSVGRTPRSVAIHNGVAWVTSRDSAIVSAIRVRDGGCLGHVPMPYGSQPEGVVVSPDGERVYVSLAATGEVVALNPSTQAIVARTRLHPDSPSSSAPDSGRWVRLGAMAVDPLTGRVLVVRSVSGATQGTLYALSANLEETSAIPLVEDPGPDTAHAGRGVPNVLSAVAVSPDGLSSIVLGSKANTSRGTQRDGLPLNFDNTMRTLVSRIDIAEQREQVDMRVDLDDHSLPSSVVYSALGDLIFVATMGSNRVDVLDAHTHAAVAGFATDLAPNGLAIDGDRLFVHGSLSRTVSVVDISALTSGRGAASPRVASIPTLHVEPLAPDVLLGKQLFHNAADQRLSSDGYIACASCHMDGDQDGRVWDFSSRGEGLRNTISLQGRGGMRHGPVHWTGNFDEIQDFEGDIREGFGGLGLMDDSLFHVGTRADALGDPKAGLSPALDALSAYVASLDHFPRSPHRNQDGTMTDAALRGADVFRSAGCGDCHAGEEMTDSGSGRLHDVGTLSDASGQRRGERLVGIDTPTLIGVWATAPYLHDGSAATLDEVLVRPGHGSGATLGDAERSDLVAYLQQLELRPPSLSAPLCLPPEASGCGCRAAPAQTPRAWWLLLPLVLGWRRRRPVRFS